jgi:hypothetical protein
VACHIPVKVTVVGRPGDDKLRRLADSVESSVVRRLAEAGRTLPAGIPVLHPPGAVQFSGDLAGTDRVRLDDVLRTAVARAIRRITQVAPPGSAGARPPVPPLGGQPFRAPFFPVGLAGGPAALPPKASAVGHDLGQVAVSPSGEVREGGSPFDGSPVAVLPGLRQVLLYSPRYAIAGSLTLALQLGMVIFPATSFAILQSPDDLYWTVGTEPAVDFADLATAGPLPGGVLAATAPAAGLACRIRGLITGDRRPAWRDRDSGVAWLRQLATEATAGVPPLLPHQTAAAVVAGADQLVAATVAYGDAELPTLPGTRPVVLDRQAFTLVPWETKAGYLRALLAATPWIEQRRTALEILASLSDGAEVDAVVALFRETGLHGRLFDDPDREVDDLFATIGEKFPREQGRLTAGSVAALLRGFDLLPKRLHEEALIGVTTGPRGTTVPEEMLDQARDAATGLVLAGNAIGESISALFTSPELVAHALESLAQLLVTVRLATLGHRPSVRQLDRFLERVPTSVAAPVRGAERLEAGDRILRRLRWREAWDIASRFGDVDNVTAAAETGEVSGDAAGVLRFLGVLGRLGEPVDAGTLTARLVMLAGALAAACPGLGSVTEITGLLARLPDDRIHRLGTLLAAARIAPGTSLDDLAAQSPDLHVAATDALTVIALLKKLAAGGLEPVVVAAFHTLLAADGVGTPGTAAVVAALPEGEGPRFAAAIGQVPFHQVDPAARSGFLELLAGRTQRMDALIDYGFAAYAAVYRRAAGESGPLSRRLDGLLGALAALGGAAHAVDFRRLLDGLAGDDPAAWARVEGENRCQPE